MFATNLSRILNDRRGSKTALCKHLDISRSTLNAYCKENNGKFSMPVNLVEETAAFLGVTVSSLFGEADQVQLIKLIEELHTKIDNLSLLVDKK